MARELVSVIIPVYNGEQYLRETLDSVALQDYDPFEIVVVDDGSTDASGAIAQSFPGVRYQHQENNGVSAARNTGIAMAKGDYTAFFDADDLMLPHKISAQAGYLREHPEIGCVMARHELMMEEGFTPPRELSRDPIFGDLDGVQWESAMVHASVIEQVGGFDPTYTMAEGLEWLGRMRSAGVGIAVLDRVVTRRRMHDDNASHQREALQSSVARLLQARAKRSRAERDPTESAP